MELSNEQIKRVEEYLNSKELNYMDIRHEVLDHIISDIENQISNNNSFEDAFLVAKQKWNKQLELSTSFITGLTFSRPKIVIQKAKNFFKTWLLFMLFFTFLIGVLIKQDIIISLISKKLELVVFTLSIISAVGIGYMYYKMKRTKTTFLFLFEKQVVPYIFLVLITIIDFDYSLVGKINLLSFLFCVANLFISVFGFKLYKNHQKVIQRYSLL